ncbi:MAG: InlB B-repeat-containing protein [Paludibacteraceae bacterium]|nr:InlB B-repeat-containing protein [Paludibacteraceae bacterium]
MKNVVNRTLAVKKTNILVINTIMKKYMKYLCAFLLLIGTSASAWGDLVRRVADISSGSFYRIKAPNGYYLVVENASGGKGSGTTTTNSGTVFCFTKESTNWYVTFNIGADTYYLTNINSASNGVVNYSSSKTAITVAEYNVNASTYYIKVGGTDKWLQSNTSSTGIFGAYGQNSHSYLETTGYSAITLKVPNGDGTWTTLNNRTSADFNYDVARSALPCGKGWETATFNNSYFINYTIPLASAPGSRPAAAKPQYSTADLSGTWYPLWIYGGKYTTDVGCYAAEYYIYYHGNGTGATGVPSTSSAYEAGNTATVSASTPTRSGYDFLGWSEDSEATSKDNDYDPGDSFTMPSSNVNLYAVWCRVLTGLDFTLTATNVSSTGVKLDWALDGATKFDVSLKKGATYDGGTAVSSASNVTYTTRTLSDVLDPNTQYWFRVVAKNDCGATTTTKTITFTTLQRYTITYDANGGTGTTPSTQYRDHGAAAVTISNGSGLSKTGHTLSRWDTKSTGDGTSYAKGASYSTNANLALYAVWTPAVYTITYKDQGGTSFSGSHVDSPSSHPTTHTYGSSTSLNSATKTGYTFEGWYTTSGCTGDAVTSLGATDYTANITLYAKWSAKTISLTLDANTANGGSTNGSGSIEFGSSSATISTAATGQEGKILLGYYDATTGGHKILETSGALAASAVDGYISSSKWSRETSPTTLYAQWSTNVYTVTFNMHDHGSSAVGSQNVAHGGKVTEPTPEPSDPDWRFDGWYKEAGYVNTWDFSTETVTAATTIHAKWTERSYNHLIFGCVDIDLDTEDSDPILVTGRNGVNIMATKKLVVNTTNAVNGHRISFSGTDLKFYKNDGTRFVELTGSNSLTVTGSAQEVYVSYNPTSAGDNAIAEPTITVSCDGFTQTFDDLVQARNLPASMVIATKVGGSWYALPATMPGERAVQPGVLVTVDETNKIAYGPSTLAYKIWPVTTVNSTNDRFGTASSYTPSALYADRVRFAGNGDDGLNSTTDANTLNLLTDITAITSVTAAPYEWKIATSDMDAYTLQADNGANTNYLDVYRPTSGGNQGKIVWATNGDYLSNEIHFFKLEEITTIDIIPREWKVNGLVFSIAADNAISLTAGDAKYGIGNNATTNATLTRHSTGGYGLYEVALPDLTSHYGKVLTLKLKVSGSDKYATTTIPIIVNDDMSTKDDAPFTTLATASKDYDVVVLSGNTLTTGATPSGAYKFQSLYLYAGSTLVNTANGNLELKYLELRGGIKGIDAKVSLDQDVPHLMLGKKIKSCTNGANLDMYVNTTHSYALSVPFNVNLANVNYANSLNTSTGAAINGTLNSQFQVLEYNSLERVLTNNGWKTINSTSTDLVPGRGYIIQAKRPKGQPFAVLRFPLSLTTTVPNWADNENGEIEKSPVGLSAAGVGDESVSDNNKAWNLVANPYMANISYKGHDEAEFVAAFTVGKLTPTDVVPWDGKFQYTKDEGSYRAYVTIPNDWYTEFPQYRANNVTFEPFKNFFVQASTTGSVGFERSYRSVAAAPALMQQALMVFEKPAYVDINLTHGSKMTQAGLTVDKDATAGYAYGEDQNMFESKADLNYLKLYSIVEDHYLVGNTLTPDEIKDVIPMEFYAPDAESDYVFSMDEYSEADDFDEIILYDAQLNRQTDLKAGDYIFTVGAQGFVENRFYINLVPKKEDSTTGNQDVQEAVREGALKFIHNDKIYILNRGVIYDATGKRVREINK